MTPRLGVNLDHIATLRQLRGTVYPSLQEALYCVERAGAHQITVHLREDRRHIQEDDVKMLKRESNLALNLEMAATDAMIEFATKLRPNWVCLVPEKRKELTTEGGLNLAQGRKRIEKAIRECKRAGIRVSLFVEPSLAVVKDSHILQADAVELHTGTYCLAAQVGLKHAGRAQKEKARIEAAARLAKKLGLHVHAGHGFDFENVRPIVDLDLIEEFNIGHAIVCRAALVGLERATREMLASLLAP